MLSAMTEASAKDGLSVDVPYMFLVDAYVEQVSRGVRKRCVVNLALDDLEVVQAEARRVRSSAWAPW